MKRIGLLLMVIVGLVAALGLALPAAGQEDAGATGKVLAEQFIQAWDKRDLTVEQLEEFIDSKVTTHNLGYQERHSVSWIAEVLGYFQFIIPDVGYSIDRLQLLRNDLILVDYKGIGTIDGRPTQDEGYFILGWNDAGKIDEIWWYMGQTYANMQFTWPYTRPDEILDGGPLTLGKEVEGALAVGQRIRYTFAAEKAGDYRVIVNSATGSDPKVHIYDRNGFIMQGQDLGADEQMILRLDAPATVQIEVGLWLDATGGDYSLKVESVENPVAIPVPGEQVAQKVELQVLQDGVIQPVTMNYLLYLPKDYDKDASQRWPFVLFLHGYGEKGDNLEMLKKHGIPKVVERDQAGYSFIGVSPQLPPGMGWQDHTGNLAALIKNLQAEFRIDANRIYVTGLSMGGNGTWHFAVAYPDIPAAIVPIAGWMDDGIPENLCDLKDMPIWVFHGEKDTVIPPEADKVLVDALKDCGAEVKYTLYPDADHEQSFTQAYDTPELYEWLLAQSK